MTEATFEKEKGREKNKILSKKKKMIAKLFCLAHFTGDHNNMITTESSRTELAKTLRQEHNDQKLRPTVVASRNLNEAEKRCSVGELEILTAVWGLEKFQFCLNVRNLYP